MRTGRSPDSPPPPASAPPPPDAAALLERVAATPVRAPGPEALASPSGGRRYLGDAVGVTFDGDDERRIALLARLLALGAAAWERGGPERDLTAPAVRLERRLRRWERERRCGAVGPRPRPRDLDTRVALLSSAYPPLAMLGIDVVTTAIAEPVAVHVLAGPASVADGIRCSGELEPVVAAAATLLTAPRDPLADDVYVRPGATLAHVEQLAWQLDRLGRGREPLTDVLWSRALWLEVAAALVFVHDVYERRAAHGARWREVQRLATDKMLVGRFRATPAAYDRHGALQLVRSVALTFAATWLDEAAGTSPRPLGVRADERLEEAAARALLAAWALTPRVRR